MRQSLTELVVSGMDRPASEIADRFVVALDGSAAQLVGGGQTPAGTGERQVHGPQDLQGKNRVALGEEALNLLDPAVDELLDAVTSVGPPFLRARVGRGEGP